MRLIRQRIGDFLILSCMSHLIKANVPLVTINFRFAVSFAVVGLYMFLERSSSEDSDYDIYGR